MSDQIKVFAADESWEDLEPLRVMKNVRALMKMNHVSECGVRIGESIFNFTLAGVEARIARAESEVVPVAEDSEDVGF